MSSIINVLDEQTRNKIAAGEVVERPASCIKELVENAIDASATAIEVEIADGGQSYMRVTDNGCGMSADDAHKCIIRHATSKISAVEDIFAISSLGFRGEAVPSIAAVSHMKITTRQEGDDFATFLILDGGVITSEDQTGAPVGTTMEVSDLFYNTPARRKFLKSQRTETSKISDMITKLALGHPAIEFTFINNGRTTLHTGGQGELKETAAAVEKSIPRRANQRQALRVLGASVASLIVGFLPYYLGLYEEEGASPDALVVTLVSCAVVLAVWVCAMRSMQDRVKAGYRGFNQAIKDALRTLGLGSERLGRRLSLYASFRRGWSLYDRQLHKDVPTHELRRLRYYDALLKTRIRDIDEIARGCHAHMTERTEASSYSREKLDQLLEDESFYNVGTSSRRRSVAEGAEASPAVPFGFISAVGFEPVKML